MEQNIWRNKVATSDGGYVIAGNRGDGTGYYNFYLIKTDDSGNVQWTKAYGGEVDECAYSVVETSDGGYALAGATTSFGAGSADFWLVKTDELGNVPEYSSWLIPSLLMVATLVIMIYKKKLLKQTLAI